MNIRQAIKAGYSIVAVDNKIVVKVLHREELGVYDCTTIHGSVISISDSLPANSGVLDIVMLVRFDEDLASAMELGDVAPVTRANLRQVGDINNLLRTVNENKNSMLQNDWDKIAETGRMFTSKVKPTL